MRIRTVETADRSAAIRVLNSAFGGEDEARLVERLWRADAVAYERVAATDDDVIGYIGFSQVAVDPPVSGRTLGLAPVAVAPAHQRQGAGSALIQSSLADLRRDGVTAVVLVGHARYYPRFGFLPASRKNVYWDTRDAGDAFQLIEFAPAFDGRARKVRYHPAFAGL